MEMLDNMETGIDAPSIAEQQQYWDERWERHKRPNQYQTQRGEAILALLQTVPLDQPKILDLGCATGWFTENLSKLGQVTGIDLSERAIAIAKTAYPNLTFLKGNIFEMPIYAEYFDLIVSQEVIAHVEDQVGFVQRIAQALKPSGYVVVTAANKVVMERHSFGPDPREHIKKWLDMKTLKRLLADRFNVIRSTSAMPLGHGGFLKFTNSHKINAPLALLFGQQRLQRLKERLNLGYTIIVLAQKKNNG
ncbi:MAG: class I SAM-dependent methyltransferase [Syntrophorhabdales bacterium]|jgi:2-polyprenyl-3-methyl-5-hydroxy-6-metoxy-1,4-benzoquinol methylase